MFLNIILQAIKKITKITQVILKKVKVIALKIVYTIYFLKIRCYHKDNKIGGIKWKI